MNFIIYYSFFIKIIIYIYIYIYIFFFFFNFFFFFFFLKLGKIFKYKKLKIGLHYLNTILLMYQTLFGIFDTTS